MSRQINGQNMPSRQAAKLGWPNLVAHPCAVEKNQGWEPRLLQALFGVIDAGCSGHSGFSFQKCNARVIDKACLIC
jgi:hypothetical protein